MNRLKTILLTMLLAVASTAAGQGYVIDSVCQGAERHYRIDGETGSTYVWTLTDPQGGIITLPETADTITIIWNMFAGNYTLSTLQTSIHGCDSLELGTIKVFDNPDLHSIEVYTSTNGLANGYAVISAGNASSSLEYSLNGLNWQASNVFTKLLAGTYTAWIRNANGCIISQQFIILNTIAGKVEVMAGNVANCIAIPVQIPVKAVDFTDIAAFTVQLAFDPSIMTFDGISNMNTLLNNGVLSTSIVSAGILEISFTSNDSLTLLSEDQLFNVNFIGISAGQTELKWNYLNCVVYSASGYEMPAVYTKGSVDIRPVPQIYTEGSDGYCEGTPLKLNAGSLTGQNLTYEWTSPTGSTHSGHEWNLGPLNLNAAGEYQVTAFDGPACATTEILNIKVYPNPQISISAVDTLCSDQEVKLNAGTGFASYKWQDGSTEPQMVATAEGIYWVIVTDYNNCQATDSVLLQPCELLLWMPNVFTPNGDGLNDEFMAKYRNDVEITFQMQIFNKWGEQIFSTNDINIGWDGTYKGVLCTEDLYTWRISFSASGNYTFLQKSPQSGNVMLLK